ncbi:MAG: hypothetical protein K6A15_08035 [Treponema sp.]|nr:hypothetical protein [Treponema sp.]
MKKMRFAEKNLVSLLLTCGLFISPVAAESFRVGKVHEASITQAVDSEATAKLGINEALAITLPQDQTFIEGLELKFEIPEAVASWMDSVACSVYANISPTPKATQIDYSGTRAYVRTLPGKLSWVLQIPIKKENSLKSNNYTTKVDTIITPSKNVIFIRLQPVMKGVPEETLNSIIPVTVKPILTNKGLLSFKLIPPEDKLAPCTVFIDEKITQLPADNKILLETGIHNVSIISEAYRNEVRTVRIEMAKVTELTVEMKGIEPTLLITAPEGTEVMLDDIKCTTIGKEFAISEGEHKIKFSIGGYEIIRSINATKGRTYTANFSLDLEISED